MYWQVVKWTSLILGTALAVSLLATAIEYGAYLRRMWRLKERIFQAGMVGAALPLTETTPDSDNGGGAGDPGPGAMAH
ncbi:MAG: hypothetical protein KJ621_14955 [Proteobacteria bacterium]|nr:hypothetical protein [Pseudomonadota bacterium]MBU1742742.1 hypothetical protein [Pseudomonadota bacterium]